MDIVKRLPGIKQGVTYCAYLSYSKDGSPDVFPSTDLTAQVRTGKNEFLTSLSITEDSLTPGRFKAVATETQTAAWPVGDVFFDVRRSSDGVVSCSDTLVVAVARRVTA